MKKKYIIVYARGDVFGNQIENLEEKVELKIQEGYEVTGGISISATRQNDNGTSYGTDTHFAQAMILVNN